MGFCLWLQRSVRHQVVPNVPSAAWQDIWLQDSLHHHPASLPPAPQRWPTDVLCGAYSMSNLGLPQCMSAGAEMQHHTPVHFTVWDCKWGDALSLHFTVWDGKRDDVLSLHFTVWGGKRDDVLSLHFTVWDGKGNNVLTTITAFYSVGLLRGWCTICAFCSVGWWKGWCTVTAFYSVGLPCEMVMGPVH